MDLYSITFNTQHCFNIVIRHLRIATYFCQIVLFKNKFSPLYAVDVASYV